MVDDFPHCLNLLAQLKELHRDGEPYTGEFKIFYTFRPDAHLGLIWGCEILTGDFDDVMGGEGYTPDAAANAAWQNIFTTGDEYPEWDLPSVSTQEA